MEKEREIQSSSILLDSILISYFKGKEFWNQKTAVFKYKQKRHSKVRTSCGQDSTAFVLGIHFIVNMLSATYFLPSGPSLAPPIGHRHALICGFPGGSAVKNLPVIYEMQVLSLVQEDLLEKEMATYSSILAWGIPWTEEPGRLQIHGVAKNWT